jgi:hypothetical protein
MVPYFWDRNLLDELRHGADKTISLLQSDILVFAHFAVVTGFLGYSHILTILEFVEGIDQKEFFFLGTAGSLQPRFDRPMTVNVVEIHASSIFNRFSRSQSLPLKPFAGKNYPEVRGVSVDLIQRETSQWLQRQLSKGLEIVEMELFPLRVYLKHPFSALVVLSDRVTAKGIEVFSQKDQLKREFIHTFTAIKKLISTGSSR